MSSSAVCVLRFPTRLRSPRLSGSRLAVGDCRSYPSAAKVFAISANSSGTNRRSKLVNASNLEVPTARSSRRPALDAEGDGIPELPRRQITARVMRARTVIYEKVGDFMAKPFSEFLYQGD